MVNVTREDAMLMIEAGKWGSSINISKTLGFIYENEYLSDYTAFTETYPRTSDERVAFLDTLNYFETLASLSKFGVLSEELLLDQWGYASLWSRIQTFVTGAREQASDPAIYENIEQLAQRDSARG